MTTAAASFAPSVGPKERLAELFDEIAELTGQRNAIDGRLVQIVAEIDRAGLCGMTGAKSVAALVAWKAGVSSGTAKTITTIANRLEEFPQCAAGMREGRLSLEQVGAIAKKAPDGSDAHFAELARSATVSQLNKAFTLEPPPEPDADVESEVRPEPEPAPESSFTRTADEHGVRYTIWLPHLEAAKCDAALQSHRDALIAERTPDTAAPLPGAVDAFLSLVEAGWDTEVARRPHGQHTTVVVHLDVDQKLGALHLGPLLGDADRRYLLCEATAEVWFERHGRPLSAGRATRTINRRLRRALEHRDTCCVVPGCGATRGLHAHHIEHWEDGGSTDLDNLVLVCPYHHRAHHRGLITITGPADQLIVTDSFGDPLQDGSLARPPTTPPPAVKPCPGPTGERAQWWWYQPFRAHPPPSTN